MTFKQKQWQLYFLGYYFGQIDGVWGKLSQAATIVFQRDNNLIPDGIFGPNTTVRSREIINNIQNVVAQYITPVLVCDGLAGPATVAATKAYQKAMGLSATGIVSQITYATILGTAASKYQREPEGDDWWDNFEFFDRQEFKCKCAGKHCNGYPAEMERRLLEVADRMRKYFGVPVTVSSGLRCQIHNTNCGGVSNSRHLSGKAMDFCVQGKTAADVLAYVRQQSGIRYSYAITKNYVHMDIE